ncbi:hypothetical protein FGIG_09376 [Fasciola gigantica]|uniref:Uncharacterized protein n=1 Tax=Fasciola gigantica TaxID=46835 RepID=A0A504Z1U4_FASGI|nr:hypothetical protein FGIG_09376 [Fasciola gigantica]
MPVTVHDLMRARGSPNQWYEESTKSTSTMLTEEAATIGETPTGMSMYTVVKLMVDGNRDVCVISKKWVSEDETHAYIPNVDGGKFHRLVRSHATLPPDTPKRPVDILIHTDSEHPTQEQEFSKSFATPPPFSMSYLDANRSTACVDSAPEIPTAEKVIITIKGEAAFVNFITFQVKQRVSGVLFYLR